MNRPQCNTFACMHLLLAASRAFLRLAAYRLCTSVSWHEAKLTIIREAVRAFLAHPLYRLDATA